MAIGMLGLNSEVSLIVPSQSTRVAVALTNGSVFCVGGSNTARNDPFPKQSVVNVIWPKKLSPSVIARFAGFPKN
jgi:hypothetical protein